MDRPWLDRRSRRGFIGAVVSTVGAAVRAGDVRVASVKRRGCSITCMSVSRFLVLLKSSRREDELSALLLVILNSYSARHRVSVFFENRLRFPSPHRVIRYRHDGLILRDLRESRLELCDRDVDVSRQSADFGDFI